MMNVAVAPGLPLTQTQRDTYFQQIRRPGAPICLDGFPLTPNGKSGGKVLRASESGSLEKIWCDLLGVPRVGRHDRFSALAGRSIPSIALSARILEKFRIWLSPQALFCAASPVSMSESIGNAQANLFSEQEVEEMGAEPAFMSDQELLAYLKD